MGRHVYRPPRGRYSVGVAILAGVVCTMLLFLAIPLSQKLSDFMSPPEPPVVEIDDIAPPPEFVQEEEPPEEVEPEPEPDDFVEEPTNLDLGLEVADLPTGIGGGIQLSIGNFGLAGDGGGGVSDELDQDPKPVSKPQPTYPRTLLQKGVGGKVQIACTVDKTGAVASASVLKTSGQAALDQAALKAAQRWKFKPAIRQGRPAAGEVIIPFSFEVRS